MLDKKVEQLLNEQINKEFYSAYLYLDFANFYQSKGLDGFANWYQVFQTLAEPLKAGLKHEEYVTSLIHNLYAAAHDVKDFRTTQFLDWFIKEQGEEETNANNLVTRFDLFGNDPKSLYMLDNELKARVYSAPSLVL